MHSTEYDCDCTHRTKQRVGRWRATTLSFRSDSLFCCRSFPLQVQSSPAAVIYLGKKIPFSREASSEREDPSHAVGPCAGGPGRASFLLFHLGLLFRKKRGEGGEWDRDRREGRGGGQLRRSLSSFLSLSWQREGTKEAWATD